MNFWYIPINLSFYKAKIYMRKIQAKSRCDQLWEKGRIISKVHCELQRQIFHRNHSNTCSAKIVQVLSYSNSYFIYAPKNKMNKSANPRQKIIIRISHLNMCSVADQAVSRARKYNFSVEIRHFPLSSLPKPNQIMLQKENSKTANLTSLRKN